MVASLTWSYICRSCSLSASCHIAETWTFYQKCHDRLPSFTHLFALHKGTFKPFYFSITWSVTTKKNPKNNEKLKTLDSVGLLILYHSIPQQILSSNNRRHNFGFFTCEIEVMTTVLATQSCCNKIRQTGWPKQQNCISHSSGYWKVTVLAGLASPETSLLGLWMGAFLLLPTWPFLCAPILSVSLPFLMTPVLLDWDPTLWPHFNLNYLLNGPTPKCSHIWA